MRHGASALALLFLLGAAALFVLATVGVPVHKGWDLLHVQLQDDAAQGAQEVEQLNVKARSGETIVQIGVLGICYHFDPSVAKNCTSTALGYSFPDLPGIGLDHPGRYRALSVALVLNPLAGGLAGVGALAWALGWLLRVRFVAILALVPVVLAKFAAVTAFGVNLAIILVLRARIWAVSEGALSGHIGTLFWFSVAGCASAVLGFLCAVLGTRAGTPKSQSTY